MKSSWAPLASAILTLLLGMLASANDLVFYDADSDCYTSAKNTYVACRDWKEKVCCTSADPFCARGVLTKTDGWTHTVYLTNSSDCMLTTEGPPNFDRCVTTSNCCLTTPMKTTDKCSMAWHFGEPDPDPNNPPHTPPPAARDAEAECHDPDVLAYMSDDGMQRRIFIPDGEFEQVVEMYTRKDFTALGRYETLEEDGVYR